MVNKIQELRVGLKRKYAERDDLVDGMLCALLAQKTLLVLGPPGTAKSDISRDLCDSLSGNFFKYLMGKFTTPEEIFGPLSLTKLQQDRYERVVTGKILEADVAFLDEIFKCNSALLNMLLPVANERTFVNGEELKLPLQVLFAASNEMPQSEDLAAFYDRFVLRYMVDRVQNEQSFRDILFNRSNDALPKISAKELEAARQEVSKLTFTNECQEALLLIRRSIQQSGIYVSDRKWSQSLVVIQAYAWLNGKPEADITSLLILRHMLWHNPDQIKAVSKLVRSVANPELDRIETILDAATSTYQEALKSSKDGPAGLESHRKMRDAKAQLSKFKSADAKAALEKLTQMHSKLLVHIGLMD